MDFITLLQFVVVLAAIFLGVRLGGIGIGYVGGAGVLVLGLGFGMKPGNVPWDVILIIASVIAAAVSTTSFASLNASSVATRSRSTISLRS